MAQKQAGHPPKAVEFAVVDLLHATQEFTRAYDAWVHAPVERADERRGALDEAERRLEDAQHEVARQEAMARSIEKMLERHRPDE